MKHDVLEEKEKHNTLCTERGQKLPGGMWITPDMRIVPQDSLSSLTLRQSNSRFSMYFRWGVPLAIIHNSGLHIVLLDNCKPNTMFLSLITFQAIQDKGDQLSLLRSLPWEQFVHCIQIILGCPACLVLEIHQTSDYENRR